ncbi:hypothetical protein GGD65_006287 [Bradyrhizobium sp. CIR18]|uniref:hypothetical protein n=1 Tax=Bradyrhizobium sp. CIR18 TaxID=2663839 RepID=UPI001605B20F|nr:hypothetical protein [Bradyrhizobium sp. CIR18]MBB4365221.1 hypothetical protein [Bradyrhizobium sp. CIR18]
MVEPAPNVLGPWVRANLRDVVTRRGYCDYDCYRRRQLFDIAFPYLATPAYSGSDAKNLVPFGLAALLIMASLASSWDGLDVMDQYGGV